MSLFTDNWFESLLDETANTNSSQNINDVWMRSTETDIPDISPTMYLNNNLKPQNLTYCIWRQ